MDPLTGAVLAAALLGTPAEPGSVAVEPIAEGAVQRPDGVARWDAEIAAAARRFVVPEAWIRAVIMAESAGDPRAVSPKGAMGLMQLMPATYSRMRQEYGLGPDPFDPGDNVMAGGAFLRKMLDRFGETGFLAAYNAGPERYAEMLSGMAALPEESRIFQETVMARIRAGGTSAPVLGIAPDTGGLFFRHALAGDGPSGRDIFVRSKGIEARR